MVATDLAAPLHLAHPEPPPPYPLLRTLSQLDKNIWKRQHQLKARHEKAQMWREALLDSGATSHFTKPSDDLPITGTSDKTVVVANGDQCQTTSTAQLPLLQLRDGAWIAHILSALEQGNSLMSVKVLSDNGYTTVFGPHDEGISVHDSDNIKLTSSKPAVLQGWCNEHGLWTASLADDVTSVEAMDLASSVYELPSTREVVSFLHASLGFPTKATLLTAIRNSIL